MTPFYPAGNMAAMTKPFSEACERNQAPILTILRETLPEARSVLEIGSGTGQHAVHFGAALPHLRWQTSDLVANHGGIQQWLDEAALPNVLPPIEFDARLPASWPRDAYDAIFSANTLHIMGWAAVEQCFQCIGQLLADDGVLAIYGPFNYGGQYTAESNCRFDAWLKDRDPQSAIRDFEAVDRLARQQGLRLQQDHAMPANNRLLVWRRAPA
jgi:SAM-dependent methyltransferase